MAKTYESDAACAQCGAHTLVPHEEEITEKKRVKFGVFWVIVTILTAGVGFLVWLVWPRKNVVVGIDRYLECETCGARQ
jgi:DNA-directed RNA polymerase subunit RPC12/RpoP